MENVNLPVTPQSPPPIQQPISPPSTFLSKYKILLIVLPLILLLSVGTYLFLPSNNRQNSLSQTNTSAQNAQVTPTIAALNTLPSKKIIYSKDTWVKNGPNSVEPKGLEYYVYDLAQKKKQLLFKLTPGSGGGFPSVGEFSPMGNSMIALDGWTEINQLLGGSGGKELKQNDLGMSNPTTIYTATNNQAIVAARRASAFSHDGQKIAFTVITAPTSEAGSPTYEIIVLDLTSKDKKVIYKGAFEKQNVKALVPVAWTKDDTKLYLSDSFAGEGGSISCCHDEFHIINSDGSNLKKLPITNRETALSQDEKFITTADGTDSKFACCGFGLFYTSTNLRIYNLLTGQFMTVANDPKSVFNVMRWSPDGDAVLYSKTFSSGGETPETYKTSTEYYVFNTSTQKIEKITSLETQLQNWNKKEYGTGWAFVDEKLIVDGQTIDSKSETDDITSRINRIAYPIYKLD